MAPIDHDVPGGGPSVPQPLTEPDPAPRRSTAEEARTLMASTNVASLATVTADGDPWASLVTYGLLADGSPVLCLSRLAEHGRNLADDPRASLVVAGPIAEDPLATGRVTLAGRAEPCDDDEARAALLAGVPAAKVFVDFGDFTTWVLNVERVRWVGGYGRMSSAESDDYAAAAPDPVAPMAAGAVAHLNEDHADALLLMAQAFSGHTDATAATCTGADRLGLDLRVQTPRGPVDTRVGFAPDSSGPGGLRAATVDLTKRARAALGQNAA